MRVTAKADYAVRAMVELAAAEQSDRAVTADRIARAQQLTVPFLETALMALRHGRLVTSRRGADGGYRLARPADQITIADILRVIDGPLADVHGHDPEDLEYPGPAAALRDVWIEVRAGLRAVLESLTIADVARGVVHSPLSR